MHNECNSLTSWHKMTPDELKCHWNQPIKCFILKNKDVKTFFKIHISLFILMEGIWFSFDKKKFKVEKTINYWKLI